MESVRKLLAWCVLAYLVIVALSGCAAAPEVRTIVVPQERIHISRPRLPIEDLSIPPGVTFDKQQVEVLNTYEESLLLCIGYAKQLEAANK